MAEAPAYIYADIHGIKRILENLIRNALVHGSGEYGFSLSKNGDAVEITISNRTDSIEEADMEHLFDRFYTTERSRTRKTTGLGLAIVKLFTEKMGGKAKVELREGIFTIRVVFPVVQ